MIIRYRPDLSIDSSSFKHQIIELKCRKRNILLVSIYHPPNTPVKLFENEYKQLITKLNEVKSCDVIIGLDHNLDFLKSNSDVDTQNFIEFNLEANFLPCITRPTRITKNTATLIDNTFISKNLQGIQDSKILITDISDHLPSVITLSGPFLEKRQTPTIITRKINEHTVRQILNILVSHAWTSDLMSDDVNIDFNLLHDRLLASLDKYAPEKRIKLTKRQFKRKP